jgi:hypothetical protein
MGWRAMSEALGLAWAESNGGGRGIRTPGTVPRTAVFKTAAIDRSAIPPGELRLYLLGLAAALP